MNNIQFSDKILAQNKRGIRILKIMTLFLMFGICTFAISSSCSQEVRLSLSLKQKTLKEVFAEIEKTSKYIFVYKEGAIDTSRKVDVSVENATIETILNTILDKNQNSFLIDDRQIFILEASKK